MIKRFFLSCNLLFLFLAVVHAETLSVEQILSNSVSSRGDQYRNAVKTIPENPNVEDEVRKLLTQVPAGSQQARQARILLTRIRYPEIFIELENIMHKWRELAQVSQARSRQVLFSP